MAVFAFDGTNKLSETGKCDLNAKCTADMFSACCIGTMLQPGCLTFLNQRLHTLL